ncbi:MAG TPA: hypothetical protein PKD78_06175 [Saprospiraceae bacterium]|nr:hypothetical protein [Saprospiraceae bacterium]
MFVTEQLVFLLPERAVDSSAKGHFGREVLVVAAAEIDEAAALDFLSKILSAARLDLERDTCYAFVPLAEPVGLASFLRSRRPRWVMVFGLSALQLGLAVQAHPYQPAEFYGSQWVFADALSVLEPDKAKKGQLWGVLKAWFLP